MGLLVDVPKPGFGTTNDGNTARRFFASPQLSSEITGVDERLISNFSKILRVIGSGRVFDIDKFGKLLQETTELNLSLYKWYYMPSTVHKMLRHTLKISSAFDLPSGSWQKMP